MNDSTAWTGHTETIPKSIISSAILATIVISTVVALVAILPLYRYLKEDAEQGILRAVATKNISVQEYYARARDVSLQITSRTRIREYLEAYNRGEIGLKELVHLGKPILGDALHLSDEVVGISRLDQQERPVIQVGLAIGEEFWPLPAHGAREVVIQGPIRLGDETCFVIGAPIINRQAERVGTDIVLFKAARLQGLIEEKDGLGKASEIILGALDHGWVHPFFPLNKGGDIGLASPLGSALQRGVQGEKGLLSAENAEGGQDVLAFAPVPGTEWGLVVKISKDELYGPGRRVIMVLAGVTAALITLGIFVMFFLLRPLMASLQQELTGRRNAEQAARESEEKQRAIFDSAMDGILLAELEDKRFTTGNSAICQMLGYSLEEIKAMGVMDIHPQEELHYVIDQFDRQARGEIFLAENVPVLRKDGSIFYADISSSPVSLGDRICLIGIFRDITERKEAEQALATSEAFRRAIIDSSHDCINVLDLAGNLLFMSLGGQCLMEITDIKKYLHKSWPDFWQGSDSEGALTACEEARQGRVGTFQGFCATEKGKAKWWDVIITPMVETDGRVQSLLVISRDITEARHQEEELRCHRDHLEELVALRTEKLDEANMSLNQAQEIAHLGNWEWSLQSGAVAWSNEQFRIFGYEPGEITPSQALYWAAVHPDDLDRVKTTMEEAMIDHKPYRIDYRISRPNHELRWILAQGRIVADQKRQATQLIGTAYDITEKKDLEAKLIQSGKLAAIGELAAGIAHELNQPLMVIRSKNQLLQRRQAKETLTPEQLSETLDSVDRNTKRMMNIINHLRIFSRQSDQGTRQPIQINKILDDCFLMIGEQLRLRNIRISRDFSPDLPLIRADGNALEQVFLNLLSNGRDSVAERQEAGDDPCLPQGEIKIKTSLDNNRNLLVIQVSDNGCGIPSHKVADIFNPFMTTKEVGKGTGLGLSISLGIIKEHQGIIVVEETGPTGTTMRVELPVL